VAEFNKGYCGENQLEGGERVGLLTMTKIEHGFLRKKWVTPSVTALGDTNSNPSDVTVGHFPSFRASDPQIQLKESACSKLIVLPQNICPYRIASVVNADISRIFKKKQENQ